MKRAYSLTGAVVFMFAALFIAYSNISLGASDQSVIIDWVGAGTGASVELGALKTATETTVSGTVNYTGLESGTHTVRIGVFTGDVPFKLTFPPVRTINVSVTKDILESGLTYTMSNVPEGTYYVGAFWDVDDEGDIDDAEPSGLYSYTDILNVMGIPLTGIDITLLDHLLALDGDYSPPLVGSPFNIKVIIQPVAQAFDAWGVIIDSKGTVRSFVLGSPASLYNGSRPLITGVPGLSSTYEATLFSTAAIPAGAEGDYTVIVGLVPAGVTPTGVESAIPGYVAELPLRVE